MGGNVPQTHSALLPQHVVALSTVILVVVVGVKLVEMSVVCCVVRRKVIELDVVV